MARHLVVTLSSHGFGHIGQTAPVVRALCERLPGLRVTLRTSAPAFKLRERFGAEARIVPAVTDVGMVQENAQAIALEASAQAYQRFHDGWERRVSEEARQLVDLGGDLVLANAPYLPLAAAQRAELPAVALCSINWMDIYAHYFSARPEACVLLDEMRRAYSSAALFLRPTPSMPMRTLTNGRVVGPISDCGVNCRAWFAEHLGLREDERLVMVSLGGMELCPPWADWPRFPGVRLIVPGSWGCRHPDTVDFEALGVPYVNALWSSDALICKPGYGSFVEAACAGLPVLYLARPGWPEVPYLVQWLKAVGRAEPLEQRDWQGGDLSAHLQRLWEAPSPLPISADGADEAAEAILPILL
ncbi:hypothetical protein [Thiococcus pfennigii]|uniref:hypothetical protein n=1 Tax=Thiococcus pfennigii TaxID=1057 RepID=UPI0019087A8C|nr:hypothetical protein [Thiococcus pfennigii]